MSVRRYLAGLFALLVMTGEARAADHEERPRGSWVFSDFEPPSDETPTYPPDPNPFPPCPEGEPWVCPKGQPFPEGCMCVSWPDGRQTPEHDDNGGLVLVDLWPEWHTRQASKLVDGGGNIEWISPRESRPPFTVADLFEAWGMFDTEDGADDPTPTLDDPSERDGFVEHNPLGTEYRSGPTIEVPPLVWYEPAQPPTPEPTPEGTPTAAPVEPTPAVCGPGEIPTVFGLCLGWWVPGGDWRVDWSIEPDLKEACVVEVIDQPVSVENPDGSSAAYLGGCEVETCPGAEPVTTCCTGESLTGHVVCQTVDPAAELYPYEPHTSIWEALEWLLTLPGSGETPAGYEGPWRYYLFTSATEGR